MTFFQYSYYIFIFLFYFPIKWIKSIRFILFLIAIIEKNIVPTGNPAGTMEVSIRKVGIYLRGLAVNLLHVSDEIEHLVRVADFVVIPADNLNEGRRQHDTCVLVEDRSAGITEEVA